MKPGWVEEWLSRLPATSQSENRSRLQGLAELLQKRRVQFLLGAGMSKRSGMLLGSELGRMMTGYLLSGKKPRRDDLGRDRRSGGLFC